MFLDVIVIDDCNGSLFVISLERKIKGMLGRDWKGFLKDENDDGQGSRVHFLYLEASKHVYTTGIVNHKYAPALKEYSEDSVVNNVDG